MVLVSPETRRFRAYTDRHLPRLLDRTGFDSDQRLAALAVSKVLPFRVNDYVLDELIDWSAVPDDPIFRLVFPQPDMLPAEDIAPIVALLRHDAAGASLDAAVDSVRRRLNPHPAGQLELNRPWQDGEPAAGLQHKYAQTVLFFPRHGQTCHSYCTYCFRWPQFVGDPALRIAGEIGQLVRYLGEHPEVTDVLITGGDPLVMRTDTLARYLEPLLDPALAHVTSIRLGSKAVGYWPHRITDGTDADALLALIERITAAGRQVAFMAHVTHPRELGTDAAEAAVRRLRSAGAVVRTQAPLVKGVNDSAGTWAALWRRTVALGGVPYYMFVERDTGPRDYFQVPLVRAWRIYRDSVASVSGLARTVRGPSMSTTAGKVVVDGDTEIAGQRMFVLRYLQARDPALIGRPFFAKFDPDASWFSDLVPVRPDDQPFFDPNH
jgi:KamA family protein